MAKPPPIRCKFCGRVGRAKVVWGGSKTLERLLWYTLLIPGPFYSFWRWKTRRTVCSYCESENFEILPPPREPELPPEEDMARKDHRF